jgi:hypothetical protein
MYGYTIAAFAAALFLVMLFVSLTTERPHDRAPRVKKLGFPQRKNPSADEPTPDRSATAKPQQVKRARRKTPAA